MSVEDRHVSFCFLPSADELILQPYLTQSLIFSQTPVFIKFLGMQYLRVFSLHHPYSAVAEIGKWVPKLLVVFGQKDVYGA